MATTRRSTVVGVFHDRRDAEHAIDELKREGFGDDQIGIAAHDADHTGETTPSDHDARDSGDPGGGAATGAITGGVVGGVLGALAAGLIPGIGPVLAGGLLAGVLGGAAVGVAAGGLLGALTGMGVPEEDARYYDNEFRGGRTIVTVRADRRYELARTILHTCGGYDMATRELPAPQAAQVRPTVNYADGPPAQRNIPGTAGSAGADRLELREEELEARTQRADAGRAMIEKVVVTEHRALDVPVTREEVIVERHPVERRPSDRPLGEMDEIQIEVHREEVVAEKRAVVYEEVELQKRTVQETEHLEADIQREVAHVNQSGDARVTGDTKSVPSAIGYGSWDEAMPSYRQRWRSRSGSSGGRWEDAEPGYRYGYEMAHDPRYQSRDWQDLETELGSNYGDWSKRSGHGASASTWERTREHAREAWEDVRTRVPGR